MCKVRNLLVHAIIRFQDISWRYINNKIGYYNNPHCHKLLEVFHSIISFSSIKSELCPMNHKFEQIDKKKMFKMLSVILKGCSNLVDSKFSTASDAVWLTWNTKAYVIGKSRNNYRQIPLQRKKWMNLLPHISGSYIN